MHTFDVQQQKLAAVFNRYPIDAAYLFGSIVTGSQTKDSDIDIAVLLEKNISPRKRFEIRLKLMGELERILKKNIDLVILNDIRSIFFKYVIIREGRIIYAKSEEKRIDFELQTLNEYFDFQPFLELYNKQYVKSNL